MERFQELYDVDVQIGWQQQTHTEFCEGSTREELILGSEKLSEALLVNNLKTRLGGRGGENVKTFKELSCRA
jgi:hypothetical protein